jgi:hypothetical protein
MGGISVDDMTSIKVDGKNVSKNYIKGFSAEAHFNMKLENNLWVVNKGTIGTSYDMFESDPGLTGIPHGHLHPDLSRFGGKTLVYTYGDRSKTVPFNKSGIGNMNDADMNGAGREGKSLSTGGTLRNVMINKFYIFLYNADTHIQIAR